jgi:hypothetical protein
MQYEIKNRVDNELPNKRAKLQTSLSGASGIHGDEFWQGFWKSAGMGAFSGALGSALGYFAPSTGYFINFSYEIITRTSTSYASSLVFDQEVNTGTFVGGIVTGIVSANLPSWHGVKGGIALNIFGEMVYGATSGGIAGGLGGAVSASLSGGNIKEGFITGAKNGAITGFAGSSMRALLLGPTVHKSRMDAETRKAAAKAEARARNNGVEYGRYGPVYRENLLFPDAAAINWGRNVILGKGDYQYNVPGNQIRHESGMYSFHQHGIYHESIHFAQQLKLGMSFYSSTLYHYFKTGIGSGPLEDGAYNYGTTTPLWNDNFNLYWGD